ncbi:MAG: DegQ family serine endoprotease [Pyrinomonadaceae bacterium]
MSDKNYRIITGKRFISISLIAIISLFALAGCKSGLFNGGNEPETPYQPPAPPAPVVVDGIRTSYADIVEKTSPAVVNIISDIKVQQTNSPDGNFLDQFPFQMPQMPQQQQRPQVERGVGSGVIVSADGTILTNNHVVADATKITVDLNNGKSYEAKVVGTDPPSDLAVLKIEAEGLPFLTLGNSDNVRVGDIVLAIGNPLGIGQTVTAGIISAKGRRTGISDGSFEDFLQTDAPINRGNSGGALVNLSGELIGINSQILAGGASGGNIGIGFSIPANMAKTVMEQLVQNGKVRRGMLGINIQNINEDLAKGLNLKDTKGVLVSNVRAGSAADKAGIKRGDVITSINGETVEDSNVLRNKVAGTLPGNEIKIKFTRDGSEQEVFAVLDELTVEGAKTDNPQNKNDEQNPASGGKLGLTLQPLTPEITKQLAIPADTKGVVVTQTDPNGAAAQTGIRRGDVILEINREQVSTLDEVKSALEKSGDNAILLLISRGGQTSFLTVKPNS